MKKLLLLTALILLPLTACIGADPNDTAPNQLIFNPVEVTSALAITLAIDAAQPLTDEQQRAVFPGLDTDFAADVYYFNGELSGIAGYVEGEIWLTLGRGQLWDWFDHNFGPGHSQRSEIHSVEVTAFRVNRTSQPFLQADFTMDNIVYRVRLRHDTSEAAQARVAELVEQIILGGPADLSTLMEANTND